MKLLMVVALIKDIGGISTSILNFIKLLNCRYDISVCVLGNYISPNAEIPKNVTLLKGSAFLENIYADRSMLSNQSVSKKIVRNCQRFLRKIIGTPTIIASEIKKIKHTEHYDVAVAFTNDLYDARGRISSGGVYDYVDKYIDADRKVAWIHNDPEKCGFTQELCYKVFANYDAVVNVSYDCKRIFDAIAPRLTDKSYVVYNLYNIEAIVSSAEEFFVERSPGINFVTVARLYNQQKRIDRIINAASRLKESGYREFSFIVIGEGGDRPILEEMIVEKGVQDCVRLIGLKPNPYPYMKAADAFLLTSDYEGYGMTIREAQILQTPVIVTNFGPASEVVTNKENGLICPNTDDGVFDVLKSILDNPSILREIKENLMTRPIDNSVALMQIDKVING